MTSGSPSFLARGPGGGEVPADCLWLLSPERDPDTNLLLPGATLSPRHQYNMAQLGLAWRPNVEPEFTQFVAELKEKIRES